MSEDLQLQPAIVTYMKREALQGHFEHSRTEVTDGVRKHHSCTMAAVHDTLAALVARDVIRIREKGREKYYHLVDVVSLCEKAWSGEDLA